MNMPYPTEEEYHRFYAEPPDLPAANPQAYASDLNLAGLIAFNPVLGDLRGSLGPDVELEEPMMWPHPEVTVNRADNRVSYDPEDQVVVKLDRAGHTHVHNHGHEITDRQAADLLGISEASFTRAHQLMAKGLRAGDAAMSLEADAGPNEATAPDIESQRNSSQHERREAPVAASRSVAAVPR